MSAPAWFDVPSAVGFRRLVATRRAFRSILITMMPQSLRTEFFGDRT